MTPEIKERLLEIANEDAEELYDVYGAEGLWVTEDDLPSDPSEFTEREYEEVFCPERIADFQKGHPLTEAELNALRKLRLDEIFLRNVGTDSLPGYCFAEIKDADDNTGIALILCTGDSFSSLSIWVHDIFETKAAALSYLQENGWTR
jgi:hypothetical protein